MNVLVLSCLLIVEILQCKNSSSPMRQIDVATGSLNPRAPGEMEAEAALTAPPRIPQLERGGKLVDLIMYALCCFRGDTKLRLPRVCASGFPKTFQRSLVHQALWPRDNAVQPQGIPVDRGFSALLVLLLLHPFIQHVQRSLIQKQSTCSPETSSFGQL